MVASGEISLPTKFRLHGGADAAGDGRADDAVAELHLRLSSAA
jgi:hypothetical protein